ncbi:MAG: hypothetical protein KUG79_17995 [Pseudomonadales bacterium]|nr:hypothetical protein [Pseudomonadales bacterium]
MTNAYKLAKAHLDAGIAEAAAENIDLNAYGQALVWKLVEVYKQNGRDAKDIQSEIAFLIDNIDDDGTYYVSRN